MSKKELLFSVTAKDCRWDYFVGQGNGGQNKQKTNSAVRCTHVASGAMGTSQEERSQDLNKRKAFVRMAETKEFKLWHKLETAKRLGKLADIEKVVAEQMSESNLRVDVHDEAGRWVEVKSEDLK